MCEDADCPFLHKRDYEIQEEKLFEDLKRYSDKASVQKVERFIVSRGSINNGVWNKVLKMFSESSDYPSLDGPERAQSKPFSLKRELEQEESNTKDFLEQHLEPIKRAKGEERALVVEGGDTADWKQQLQPFFWSDNAKYLEEVAKALRAQLKRDPQSEECWVMFAVFHVDNAKALRLADTALDAVFSEATTALPFCFSLWQLWAESKKGLHAKLDVLKMALDIVVGGSKGKADSGFVVQLICSVARLYVVAGRHKEALAALSSWTEKCVLVMSGFHFVNLHLLQILLEQCPASLPRLTPQFIFDATDYVILPLSLLDQGVLSRLLFLDNVLARNLLFGGEERLPVLVNLVRALHHNQRLEEARVVYDKLISACPGNSDVQWLARYFGFCFGHHLFSHALARFLFSDQKEQNLKFAERTARLWTASLRKAHEPEQELSLEWMSRLSENASHMSKEERVCAWLCLVIVQTSRKGLGEGLSEFSFGRLQMMDMDKDLLALYWSCYLSFLLGCRAADALDSSMWGKAVQDLVVPNPWYAKDAVICAYDKSVRIASAAMQYDQINAVMQRLLQSQSAALRRNVVAECFELTPHNASLVMWSIRLDLQASDRVSMEGVRELRNVAMNAIKQCPQHWSLWTVILLIDLSLDHTGYLPKLAQSLITASPVHRLVFKAVLFVAKKTKTRLKLRSKLLKCAKDCGVVALE